MEMGLVPSLRSLFDTTQMRSDFVVSFNSELLNEELGDELSMCIYRIIQELLANATKHSQAREIKLKLQVLKRNVVLEYADDGIGVEGEMLEENFGSMGIYGMRQRVRSMNGGIRFYSRPEEGLKVWISIPSVFNTVSNLE